MYTQCPNCGAAFRVTADVLRVAGGKVRCGSCGVAFNALNHLSEHRPEPAASAEPEPLPELRPEGAQSEAADAGMEWRFADGDPAGQHDRTSDANGRDTLLDAELSQELATPRVDEVLSDTPTPLDEVLTDAGHAAVDSAEVFAPEAAATTPDSELRFDDHTGLPDDYGSGDDEAPAPAPIPAPTRDAPEPLSSLEVDLGLDNPDEWRDILAEVGPGATERATAGPPTDAELAETDVIDTGSVAESGAMTLEEELDALEIDLDEPEDEPQADELADQMEALSIELSGLQEELDLLSEQTSEQAAEQAAEPTIADELEALDLEPEEDPAPVASAELPSESFQPPVVEAPTDHVVPPPTEEEETINRLIDQDLLALAIEDEEGMASTIVLEESGASEHDDDSAELRAFAGRLPDDASPVETIIMEGDTTRSGDAPDDVPEPQENEDIPELPAAVVTEAEEPPARNWRMIGGAAALAALLLLQAVHFSRHSLATVPMLYGVLEPVYAAVGQPLNPAWDITGWRFEATRGSTDEAGETLTIYSRIGNNSEAALPYPVISVALTDRFEETIGSRVLEPADYLGDDVDSGRLVPAGTTFNASIAIESPADAAMGFKLNVCYRQTGDRLRCAIEDFRD